MNILLTGHICGYPNSVVLMDNELSSEATGTELEVRHEH